MLTRIKNNNIKFHNYGVIFNEDEKQKIMQNWDLGYNGQNDNMVAGLSYKSLDYLSYGIPLLNSVQSDTWNLIEKKRCGINFNNNKHSLRKLVEIIDKMTISEIYEVKCVALDTFDTVLSWNVYKKKMDALFENNTKYKTDIIKGVN